MERTLDIADPLLHEAEEKALRDGTTLLALVEQGLRVVVAQPRKPDSDEPYRLVIKPFRGNGLQPGVKTLHWDEIGPLVYDEEDRFR